MSNDSGIGEMATGCLVAVSALQLIRDHLQSVDFAAGHATN
jgi:hypothetical protein